MNVYVTGIAGFIGSHVAESLLKASHLVQDPASAVERLGFRARVTL